ncbi:MAG: hypothetical protein EPO68_06460 [Planctomycetota bacterium]|nr:MAG: hypothetical protein EPO68_06460 [Planctomycetota bacterium]
MSALSACLVLSLALAAGAGQAGARDDAARQAPDGRPGFGTRAPNDVAKLVRQPARDGAAWIDALAALPTEISQRASLTESLYRERGWFALSGDQPGQGLLDLHASYRHLELDPTGTLYALDERARAFAAAWTDMRFRSRARLLESAANEVRELDGALALLRGAANSWGTLSESEAQNLARRADLSAALLRAIRLDLDALRESPGPRATPLEADECLALARDTNAARRSARMDELSSRLAEREQAFLRPLFWMRLSERCVAPLAWRKSSLDLCRAALQAAEQFSPDVDPERPRDGKVAALRATDRRRHALARALEALAQDPLDERATWIAFASGRHVGSVPQTLALAYRYLRLRGIVYEDGVQQGRGRMTENEEAAETYVREALAGAYGAFPGAAVR